TPDTSIHLHHTTPFRSLPPIVLAAIWLPIRNGSNVRSRRDPDCPAYGEFGYRRISRRVLDRLEWPTLTLTGRRPQARGLVRFIQIRIAHAYTPLTHHLP